jgi:hypothetical protein
MAPARFCEKDNWLLLSLQSERDARMLHVVECRLRLERMPAASEAIDSRQRNKEPFASGAGTCEG